ncbi:MAG: DUF5107 domain-containing protein [Candidatus Hydrogenedentes bacterium]|nr:DUF5107 domain-containing protein [Candidatus Hydrogenedentota bacterium]
MKLLLIAALMLLAVSWHYPASAQLLGARARAWEGTITIPTYPWGPDDVNPKFYELEGFIFYPYPMQDNLSNTKIDRTYKALFLENEYLKVTCLPELGGRLHSVLDKTEGKEMFHCNHVIKPGLIGLRGAWISGGVEWNTGPQGHTVTDVSPVDALAIENENGSASLIIGNTEKISRTRWTVRVTLHPGKAYLDEDISMYNPTDGIHPYYFWNNTAFPCHAGTRFIYPMTLGTDHAGAAFFQWPIHEGRDLTWLKSYPEPTSVFAYRCAFDFFGAYDVVADRGIVQHANHQIVVGKKAWTWGQADFGLLSQKALTDDDGPYIEVQSGPLETQANYGMLAPGSAARWSEAWYPVHGLGEGFEYATREVAVQRYWSESGGDAELELRVIATAPFDAAVCTLSTDSRTLLRGTVNLSPFAAQKILLRHAPKTPIEVSICSEDGIVLAAYTTPLPIPEIEAPRIHTGPAKPDNQLTAEERYLKGKTFDEQSNRIEARNWYERALVVDPQHSDALRALAVLDLESGRYEEAAQRLESLLQRNPDDGTAWYYLGVVRLRQGNFQQAQECGYRALKTLELETRGWLLVARALTGQRKFAEASEMLERASGAGRHDPRLTEYRTLALLGAGNIVEAQVVAEAARQSDPLALVPRAVLALIDTRAMEVFVEEAKTYVGEYEFELLETALTFADAGLTREAVQLLKTACPADKRHQSRPMPLYYLAYWHSQLGEKKCARDYLKHAAMGSPDYVFPSRVEEIDILSFAIRENPRDAHAHLYFGNLYAGLGRHAEAIPHWQKAADLDRRLSVAWRNLALHAWKRENVLSKAEKLYRKAIAARPGDQILYRDLANVLLAQNRRTEAIPLLEKMPYEEDRRADILLILANAYLEEKRYSDAIQLLEGVRFSNWEGQTGPHDAFVRAHLARGKERFDANSLAAALDDFTRALSYPENLGVGRPAFPEEAEALYWKGRTLRALGREPEARAAWQEAGSARPGSDRQNEHRKLSEDALALSPATS